MIKYIENIQDGQTDDSTKKHGELALLPAQQLLHLPHQGQWQAHLNHLFKKLNDDWQKNPQIPGPCLGT